MSATTEASSAANREPRDSSPSDKVHCDLYGEIEKRDIVEVYLQRIGQFISVPIKLVIVELGCSKRVDVGRCQRESRNMGARTFAAPCLEWRSARSALRSRGPVMSAGSPLNRLPLE
jgi:2-oxoglutarate dehydrogenase complex dehydrogenase (E1) component-like enzyme